jgi:putative CRISPR-associated protein (TIGR02619 family)
MASLVAMDGNEGIGDITSEDMIALLYSKTPDGKVCAEINAEAIKHKWQIEPDMKEVAGLDPDKPEIFATEGLKNLIDISRNLLVEYSGGDYDRYFNITGGYKGAIPIQTLQAIMKNVPIIYLFENSKGFIKIELTCKGIKGSVTTDAKTEVFAYDMQLG